MNWKKIALAILSTALVGGITAWLLALFSFRRKNPEPHWDWSSIDLDDLDFPDDMLWGVANAAHQVEGGCDNNNWSRWEAEPGRIADGHVSGDACQFYTRFAEDIALARAAGARAFRFSVEWSKLQPEPDTWDEEVLAHYRDQVAAMHAAGMVPMLTLHHFTQPRWFDDKGGWEARRNIQYFVSFAQRLFSELGAEVPLWCTINEPEVFTTQGWFVGMFPPGKKDALLVARVLANLLEAHSRVYHSLKLMPGGDQVQIGLVKNIFQFDPLRRHSLPDWIACHYLDQVFNESILQALQTGHFEVSIPGLVAYERAIPKLAAAGDFIGLNYYSHFHVKTQLSATMPFDMVQRPSDLATDMPYAVYAEGFHRALLRIDQLDLPVYVTENGIADARDDRRELFIRRYLYALSKAWQDGVDVRGYFYWTLVDNFEWSEGWHMCFGLYHLDRDTQERTLRPGSMAFVDIATRHEAYEE